MTKKLLFYASALLVGLTFTTLPLKAQVTIGSDAPPRAGALLDLTNKTDGSSDKGLNLPRVNLLSLSLNGEFDNLAKTIKGASGTWDKDIHVGLVVYHIQDKTKDVCNRIPSGVYLWTGTNWQFLQEKGTEGKPSYNMPITTKQGLDQPNSYLVTKPSVVKIPIEKAIKAWDGTWKTDAIDRPANKVILPVKSFNIANLAAELVWDDQCGSLIINANDLKIINEGGKEYIEVWVGSKKGNAVIGLYDKTDAKIAADPKLPVPLHGTTKYIWSWHIWATDEPELKTFNNFTWLDRNLGATSATPDDFNSVGLLYQWGRKDPIPGVTKWNSLDNKPIYKADGTELDYIKQIINVVSQFGSVNWDATPALSVNCPSSVLSNAHQPNGSFDWFVSQSNYWRNRWGGLDKSRSVMEPCPEGWRVPIGTGGNNSPWVAPTNPWNGFTSHNSTWTGYGRIHPDAGYYPNIPIRPPSAAVVYRGGAYWTASPKNATYPSSQGIDILLLVIQETYSSSSVEVTQSYSNAPTNGYAVRCVKE